MNKKPFFSLAILIAASWIIILSCSKSSSNGNNSTTSGQTVDISMSGMLFSPSSKTVTKGTVIKWTNNDGFAHTVTSNDGTSFDSGNIAGGATYSYTAAKVGTFDYHCNIHGVAMSGKLIVNP